MIGLPRYGLLDVHPGIEGLPCLPGPLYNLDPTNAVTILFGHLPSLICASSPGTRWITALKITVRRYAHVRLIQPVKSGVVNM
jgi:hypothetical protein